MLVRSVRYLAEYGAKGLRNWINIMIRIVLLYGNLWASDCLSTAILRLNSKLTNSVSIAHFEILFRVEVGVISKTIFFRRPAGYTTFS